MSDTARVWFLGQERGAALPWVYPVRRRPRKPEVSTCQPPCLCALNTDMTQPKSLVHAIERWAQIKPYKPALRSKRPGQAAFSTVTWREYWQSVREVAMGLMTLGHEAFDSVAIVGRNRPEWVQFQFGIQAARGVPAPIYPTNTPEQVAHILKNCGARIVICDDQEQLDKYRSVEGELDAPIAHFLTFDEMHDADPRVVSFEKLRLIGRTSDKADEFKARLNAITPDDTCGLIYTSGTTGVPKGVILDHAGQHALIRSLFAINPDFYRDGRYRVVSYLPLCHQAEQLLTNVASLEAGGEVYFCPDIADVKEYLLEARPTVFLGVPRVWEKFQAALTAKLGEATGAKAVLAKWALKTELDAFKGEVRAGAQNGAQMTPQRMLARRLVINKIKEALGMDQLDVAITGAAPIAVSTQEFFASLGILINEAYGLSETSGVATVTELGRATFGTVGKPLPCVSLRIAEDGEVQVKGRNMTRGYLNMEEETKALYTEDGWLMTGDLGSLDAAGNLLITGRKKELIITAGGKNVAPVEMENLIKGIFGVGQVVVVGDRRPYLSALITLDVENLDELCQRLGVKERTLSELANNRVLREYLHDGIERECNQKVARYQTVKKFEIMPAEFTVDGGELTPTMKLRRNIIHEKYAAEIDAFYGDLTSGTVARA